LAWYLDGKEQPGRLTNLFRQGMRRYGAKGWRLLNPSFAAHAMTRLSPAAAMFGALSPRISETVAMRLFVIALGSREAAGITRPIDQHVRNSPVLHSTEPWDDGYRLALDLLDDLVMTDKPGPFNLDGLLDQWDVVRKDEALDQDGPLGVALAGPEITPTIVINRDHAMNQHEYGKRFTTAHELCHLLHDRDRAQRIAHSSTQWAPLAIEQRANAFAAMLLMPPGAVRHAFHPGAPRVSRADVSGMARDLQVGLRAAIQHLANLGHISDEDRTRLLDEAVEAGATPRPPHPAAS
jgi:Zn-dependent peptidase ImmA (M78 family)